MPGPERTKYEAKQVLSNSEGQWGTGHVIKLSQNKPSRKWFYHCVFDTPLQNEKICSSGDIKVLRDNYLKLQATRCAHALSSDDGLSSPEAYASISKASSRTPSCVAIRNRRRNKGSLPMLHIPGTQDENTSAAEEDGHASTSNDEQMKVPKEKQPVDAEVTASYAQALPGVDNDDSDSQATVQGSLATKGKLPIANKTAASSITLFLASVTGSGKAMKEPKAK